MFCEIEWVATAVEELTQEGLLLPTNLTCSTMCASSANLRCPSLFFFTDTIVVCHALMSSPTAIALWNSVPGRPRNMFDSPVVKNVFLSCFVLPHLTETVEHVEHVS